MSDQKWAGTGGCSYTGSAGGPAETETPICANDAADMASITSANNNERMGEMIRILFPLAGSSIRRQSKRAGVKQSNPRQVLT
jgi:hypothetical protein